MFRSQSIGDFTKTGLYMKIGGYDSDELKCFHRVLEAAMAEARAKSLDLPVHDMTRRLFAAADRGERSPQGLRAAILGNPTEVVGAGRRFGDPIPLSGRLRLSRKRKPSRRLLTLFRDRLSARRSAVW
jgi:hypothetical protein